MSKGACLMPTKPTKRQIISAAAKRVQESISQHTDSSGMDCDHKKCCLCLRKECQLRVRFKKFDGLYVCGDSCISSAITLAYGAACRFEGSTEKPCGNIAADSQEAQSK